MTKKLLFLALLALITLFLSYKLYQAINFREAIFSQPNEDKEIVVDGEKVTIKLHDYLLNHVAKKQLNRFDYWLVNESTFFLMAILYMLMGLEGSIVYFFLSYTYPEIVGLKKADIRKVFSADLIFSRCFLSLFSGLITFLIMICPISLLSNSGPENLTEKIHVSTSMQFYSISIVFPLVAGLFTDKFYSYLKKEFPSIMKQLFKKGGPS